MIIATNLTLNKLEIFIDIYKAENYLIPKSFFTILFLQANFCLFCSVIKHLERFTILISLYQPINWLQCVSFSILKAKGQSLSWSTESGHFSKNLALISADKGCLILSSKGFFKITQEKLSTLLYLTLFTLSTL